MRRGKELAFAGFTVVAFFAIVEALLWAGGVSTLRDERDPFLGFSRRVPVFELDEASGDYVTREPATRHSFHAERFPARKPDGGLRIFVLGGSSAYGFPWDETTAFSGQLETALRARWPERPIEVINAAAMSYASHRLRILTHELLRYEPDLLIVYGGHNEFIERRFYRDLLSRDERLDPVRAALHRWRLFALGTRLYEKLRPVAAPRGDGSPSTGELLGFDVVRENRTRVDPQEREEVRARFEENLRAIAAAARERGVGLVLCTVPSNRSGWVPNGSRFTAEVGAAERAEAEGLLEQARAALADGAAERARPMLDRAARLAPGHAEIAYLRGRAYEQLGRWEDARAAYVEARDWDSQPSRAVSALNETIRRVAAEEGATLVDVEAAFEKIAPHGLLGFALFEDYVHPKPGGHRWIALELWRSIVKGGLLGPAAPAEPVDDTEFWIAVGADPDRLLSPGSDRPLAATDAKTASQLYNLAVVLGNQGLLDEAIDKYRECLDLDPAHPVARSNLGRLLVRQGRLAEAEREFRSVLSRDPEFVLALLGLGETQRRMDRLGDAEATFERAVAADPASVGGWRALGLTRRQRNDFAGAAEAYEQAERLDSAEPEIPVELGVALLSAGRPAEARRAFERALTLDPEHLGARVGVAMVHAELGDRAAAERAFREVLERDPGNEVARRSLQLLARSR